MPFTPGNSFGTGRPKGALNKVNDKVRSIISALTEAYAEDFDTALAHVQENNPQKFAEIYLKLLEYSMPKMRAIESTVDLGEGTIEKITVEVKTKPQE